ncbi:hypothetical protein [Demequina aurantiaca]|uniref:hypothetical protein n=1 Tax=Demequina aurantiaca TaxID=676200 RepID=UPI003D353E4C
MEAIFALVFVMIVLLSVAAIGGAIWFAIHRHKREKARRAALASYVTARGYGYLPEYNERAQLFVSNPFGLGNNRRALDVVWGAVGGRPFETFAYRFETQTTNGQGQTQTQVHPYQVAWIPMPASVPTMRLTADGAFQRFFAKMGAKDLEVESHHFNERWKVWCADERIGHAVLTPALIDFMLAPGWAGRSLVIEGRLLMTYSKGHTNLTDLEGVVGGLYGFLDQMPKFLFTDQQY